MLIITRNGEGNRISPMRMSTYERCIERMNRISFKTLSENHDWWCRCDMGL